MNPEHLAMHKGEAYAIGLLTGVIVTMAVMYFPLQHHTSNNDERLKKIEKRIFKNI